MDFDLGKLWLLGAGLLVGAIGGAWIWAQRAAAMATRAAQAAGEDALINAARNTGTATIAASLQGALVGAIIGIVLVGAWIYFSDPDRGMKIRRVGTGDDRW
jgi:hypothetical protein